MSQLSAPCDSWEYGTEITSKITGPKYWKLKLKTEAQKAVAMRDKHAIAELIMESAQLRDQSNETSFTSQTMMILVSGAVTAYPDDPAVINFGKELNKKLPKIPKTKVYKELLNRNANKIEETVQVPQSENGVLNIETPGQYVFVSNENIDHSCDVVLLRYNPLAAVDIIETSKLLDWKEYTILVDRIDIMPQDLPSWTAFHNLLINMNEDQVKEVAEYVSYWAKLHKSLLNAEGDNELSHILFFIFELLHLLEG